MRTASVSMSTEEAAVITNAWRKVSGNMNAGLGEALYGFALKASAPTEKLVTKSKKPIKKEE